MESSQPKPQSSEHRRRSKFTDTNVRQIINLVERGTSAAEIAEIIGVTLGTLKTTCSKLRISLRRPSFDTGTGLLRHRRSGARNSGSSVNSSRVATHPSAVPRETPPAIERPPAKHRSATVSANETNSDYGPLAIAVVMQYKGETHTVELPLTHDLIGQLAIEAEFRRMNLIQLIAQAVESLAKNNHFDLLLGQIPKRISMVAPGSHISRKR